MIKIKDIGPHLPKVDGYEVAQALGAELVDPLEAARKNWRSRFKKRVAVMEWLLGLSPDVEDRPTLKTDGDD